MTRAAVERVEFYLNHASRLGHSDPLQTAQTVPSVDVSRTREVYLSKPPCPRESRGFKKLVDSNGSETVTIGNQYLQLDGLVAKDGSIREADAHIQRIGERAYLMQFPENGEVSSLLELVGSA